MPCLATRPGSLRQQLYTGRYVKQGSVTTHLSPPPQTLEATGPSKRVSKTLYLLGFLSSASCNVSGLNLEEADEAADLGGLPEVLLFKIFNAAQFQFLALCRLANSKPETQLLVITDGKYSLYFCSAEKFSFQHLFT